MKTPKEILDEMLDLTNKLAGLNKELESQKSSGPEWLAINNIEEAIGEARSVFEQKIR